MTPIETIQAIRADGVTLILTTAGSIKTGGDLAAVQKWIPAIREHKDALIAELQETEKHFLWRIEFPDCRRTVSYSPVASRAEVLTDYPGAIGAEPLDDPIPARHDDAETRNDDLRLVIGHRRR